MPFIWLSASLAGRLPIFFRSCRLTVLYFSKMALRAVFSLAAISLVVGSYFPKGAIDRMDFACLPLARAHSFVDFPVAWKNDQSLYNG